MDEMGMDMGMLPRRLTVSLCDKTWNTEVSGDFTLPDYQPPIRRVLYVGPTVLPPAKYVGGAGVELNGTVDYQVWYVGADGGLYSVPFSAEYTAQVPLEQVGEVDWNEGVTVLVSTVCEGVNVRVGAPRKMSLRTRLRLHVWAYGALLWEESCRGAAEPESIRRLTRETSCLQIAGGVSDMLSLQDEITGLEEDTRVISAEGTVFLSDVRAENGKILASGDVILTLLVGHENGETATISRRLPVAGEVEAEGVFADGSCRARGVVSDLTVSVEEGKITCDVGVLLEGRGMRNLPLTYTADLYSTQAESACEYADHTLPVALKCENRNLSQSERIPREDLTIPEGAELVTVWGEGSWETCEAAGDKYVLNGQSRYLLLWQKDGEYGTAEVTLPLRYETEGAGMVPVGWDAEAEAVSCRARREGDHWQLDAEWAIIADFVGSAPVHLLESVQFGEPLVPCQNRMTVYYPVPGDTPWSVAKRYHVPLEQLTEGTAYYIL